MYIKNLSIKSVVIVLLKVTGILIGIILIYALLGYLLPFIEVSEKDDGEAKEIPIYIYTNGVHTDIVMPVKNDIHDWSSKIPFSDTKSGKTDYQFVGIGWGDKGFYLDTPTWADLKFSTAFKAAFWMSESAMHCSFYRSMTEADDCKKIMISRSQYRKLIDFVDAKFDKDDLGNYILIPTNAVYGDNDAFYDAKGRYSFLNTCNTWANDALKAAGQKAAFWTPSDYGIFLHYK
ncbi:TIGR02117 family protein [Flavobacteriaceae bacterium W22]|uniref:TIGR02117 family protein n=1 Tax=Chryseobacterium binzhouense TaxID=2593646 RepID=UPI001369B633|nr:TIGR02117 family protein [Chryseobacterium binzhouense]MXS70610.1 TIGR02117 family protein [Flavobacteriaceae bacterium W22]